MDSATADLIYALQLQDLADIRATDDKDASQPSEKSNDDATVAFDMYCDELRANASITADHSYAEVVGVVEDPDALPDGNQQSATPMTDEIFVRSFTHLTCSDDNSSSESFDTASYEDAPTGDCIVCLNQYLDLMSAPCGHLYCKDDICQLFDQSLLDESLFPPRCCRQIIPLDLARPFLTSTVADRFDAKSLELSTLDRTYCYKKECATFIPPRNIENEKATCEHCGLTTCTICKNSIHDGECPEDPAHQSFMAAAQAAGFQKCFQCNRMVELHFGCNHIT